MQTTNRMMHVCQWNSLLAETEAWTEALYSARLHSVDFRSKTENTNIKSVRKVLGMKNAKIDCRFLKLYSGPEI